MLLLTTTTRSSSRSFSANFDWMRGRKLSRESGLPLAKIYDFAGIRMKKGSGHDSDHYVPILKEWFYVDPEKEHFVTGEKGAPRVYVFDTCVNFIRTIKRWVWVERKTKSSERLAKESPTKSDDDLCDCMKLMIQAKPMFRGNALSSDTKYYADMVESEPTKLTTNRVIDRRTGY